MIFYDICFTNLNNVLCCMRFNSYFKHNKNGHIIGVRSDNCKLYIKKSYFEFTVPVNYIERIEVNEKYKTINKSYEVI